LEEGYTISYSTEMRALYRLKYNPSSAYTALSDNAGDHLWASKLMSCTVITATIITYNFIAC
jgi:hypothetical protein